MEKRSENEESAREWFVLWLADTGGDTLRGRIECTGDSERRQFDSTEELLAILYEARRRSPNDPVEDQGNAGSGRAPTRRRARPGL